jgi:hypothetical protein
MGDLNEVELVLEPQKMALPQTAPGGDGSADG